jgi:hypothetical protein
MWQIESFFWGIIAALGALVVELVFFLAVSQDSTLSFHQFFLVPQFIIVAALLEETFKYIVISERIEMFSLRRSYIINSFLVGLGFFGTELALISNVGTLPAWQPLAGIAMVHIGTAGLIGYLVAVKNPKKITTFLSAVAFAAFFHVLYNLLTLKSDQLGNYPVLLVLMALVFINIANFFRINRSLQ